MGTHVAANAGILLAAVLTGSAVGAEQAGDVAAQTNNSLATNGDLATSSANRRLTGAMLDARRFRFSGPTIWRADRGPAPRRNEQTFP
jgi:hypothetical protein